MLSRAPLRVPSRPQPHAVTRLRHTALGRDIRILIGILSLAALRRGVRSVDGASLAGLGARLLGLAAAGPG